MNHEISNPAELDAAIAGKELAKRARLWKAAEGRLFRWPDVAGAILGGLLCLTGLYSAVVEQDINGAVQLAFGVSLLCFSMLRHQQTQIDALREIAKEFDRDVRLDSSARDAPGGDPMR